MYLLGLDIGSSSIKAALINADSGECIASDFFPKAEMSISSPQVGFAEQNPENWWENTCLVIKSVLKKANVPKAHIKGIGISYQMHGLVLSDEKLQVLRPSIIWCDSRAVEIGNRALEAMGKDYILPKLLNSTGNFTASKMRWVIENQPEIYQKTFKMMLPGDYIAARLTGEICTTASGLSEGILWDFSHENVSVDVLKQYEIDKNKIADIAPTFGIQGKLKANIAQDLGLELGTPISYRAGDQPNNALSLNVLEKGEVAATAGTSGVIYGVSDERKYDVASRVNTFLHVNHTAAQPRYGVLLCVNGTGILNSWLKNTLLGGKYSYEEMNALAATAPIGSDGLRCLPFGNGAERMLKNQDLGAKFQNLQLNRHGLGHWLRASQEGIVFALYHGLEIMKGVGVQTQNIRAGYANMFFSPVFAQTLANLSGASIELYNTDGAIGAARGAGIGIGYYKTPKEAFSNLQVLKTIEPNKQEAPNVLGAFQDWKTIITES